MREKYMLVCVCEREIEHPQFFDTVESAHDAMLVELANFMGITTKEVTEMYTDEYDVYDNVGFTHMEAWAEHYGRNIDWKIFDVGRLT